MPTFFVFLKMQNMYFRTKGLKLSALYRWQMQYHFRKNVNNASARKSFRQNLPDPKAIALKLLLKIIKITSKFTERLVLAVGISIMCKLEEKLFYSTTTFLV